MFRCSQQKLSDLARQLCGLPLDAAILQAKFSPKKASEVLYQTLAQALSMAKARNKSPSEYIIKEAITGRGKYMKRLDIKGRGRCGVICRPHAFMRFVMAIPDERKELAKLLKIRHFPHEHKPSYVKLDY